MLTGPIFSEAVGEVPFRWEPGYQNSESIYTSVWLDVLPKVQKQERRGNGKPDFRRDILPILKLIPRRPILARRTTPNKKILIPKPDGRQQEPHDDDDCLYDFNCRVILQRKTPPKGNQTETEQKHDGGDPGVFEQHR